MTAAHTDPFAWWQQWMKQAPSLPLPGFAVPTLDLDELDRRIREYRTVEGWLQMNLSSVQMMRQSLEMQRAAVAAWQEMKQNWQQAPAPEATAPSSTASAHAAKAAAPQTTDTGDTQTPPIPNPFELMKAWWDNTTQAMASAATGPSADAASTTSAHATTGADQQNAEATTTKPTKRKRTTKRKSAPAAGTGESGSEGRSR